jgi:hypothetical protein
MSPRRSSCWLPLTRLAAFFVAVVVTGTLFLRAIHTPASGASVAPGKKRSLEKHRKKLERTWERMRFFLGAPAVPATPKAAVPSLPAKSARGALFDPVLAAESSGEPLFDVKCPDCGESWIAPGNLPRTIGYSLSLVEFHRQAIYDDLPRSFRSVRRGWFEQTANAVFSFPEEAMDSVVDVFGLLFPDPPPTVAELGEQGMLTRLFQGVSYAEGDGRTFSHFMDFWYEREIRFLKRFDESSLNTYEVEDGTGDIDLSLFLEEQRKILWDAARRTYFGRFREVEERARDEAFYVGRWKGLDYVFAPALLGAMVYYRGFDKKFSLGPARLRVEMEPVRKVWQRWSSGEGDVILALGIEFGVKDFPVRFLASVGVHEGDLELEFVGIGTGLNEVKRMLRHLSRD